MRSMPNAIIGFSATDIDVPDTQLRESFFERRLLK